MAIDIVDDLVGGYVFSNDLVECENIPNGYFDVWEEDNVEGIIEVVALSVSAIGLCRASREG